MESRPPDPARLTRAVTVPARLERILLFGVLPLFVVSQWLAVKWQLPTRQMFNALILVGVGAVAASRLEDVKRFRREVVLGLLLAVFVAVSALVNAVPLEVALRGSVPYLGLAALAVGSLALFPSPRDLRRAGTVATGTAALMGVLAVAELIGGAPVYRSLGQNLDYPLWWERGRATGLVANPGRLGQVGAIGIALAPLTSRYGIILAVLAGAAVGTSGSRLAIAATVVMGLLSLVVRKWKGSRLLWVGALAALSAFAIVQVAVPAARQDLASRNQAVTSQLTHADDITDVRVANLKASSAVWKDHPVFGAGPGRFGSTTAWRTHSPLHEQYGLPDVRSPEFVERLRSSGDTRQIDVGIAQLDIGWLQIGTELGAGGLLLVGALLISLVVRAMSRRSLVSVALLAVLAVVTLGSPGIVDLSLTATVFVWFGSALGNRR
ncbi:MAG: hypothetical protein GWP04_00855 [Gammaproteobacteria bacterium]|nr:hypothetical protein [Gammaproteobacteria bacterium]